MLKLNEISKSYDHKKVLNNLSLTINQGEIVSVLGSSGSGKTTLLNCLLGIVKLDSGTILLDGKDITNEPIEKRGFNIVFQDYALFPHLSAYRNIIYGLKNNPSISSQEEVDALIDLLELREHLTKDIDHLSGGQKQRVALARTLTLKPKVLLLDEPLSALDGVIRESIKETIQKISRTFHLTTIIVTHDPEEALTMSDKVLILNQGEIAQFDTPEMILKHPKDTFVESFILKQLYIKKDNITKLFGELHVEKKS